MSERDSVRKDGSTVREAWMPLHEKCSRLSEEMILDKVGRLSPEFRRECGKLVQTMVQFAERYGAEREIVTIEKAVPIARRAAATIRVFLKRKGKKIPDLSKVGGVLRVYRDQFYRLFSLVEHR